MICTNVFVITMLCMVVAVVASVILMRITLTVIVYTFTKETKNEVLISQSKLIVSMFAAGVNLICILILNQIYQRIALKLTMMELPRTQTEFEDNFTMKIFLFQILNFYSSLIYIAFFKVRWSSD